MTRSRSGAGPAGISQLYQLREQGLSVKVFEVAEKDYEGFACTA